MTNLSLAISNKKLAVLRWVTRISSLVISGEFLFIALLAITNEDDRPEGVAWLVLGLLLFNVASCFLAWWREKMGGGMLILGSIFLGSAAYYSALIYWSTLQSFLPALIYGVPFLVLGFSFWALGVRSK